MVYEIQCLDETTAKGVNDVADTVQGKRGAEFIYSRHYDEWMIVCRDLSVKRRLRKRYKAGLAIYTLSEVTEIGYYPPDMAAEIHEMVRRFGVEIEETK